MMRCPRCQQENPESGQFCTRCGLPLTPEAQAAYFRTERRQKSHSRAGAALSGIAKAVCYVLLFVLIQSAVIGLYSMYYAIGEMGGLLTDSFSNPVPGNFSYDITEELMQAVYENISVLTLISGIVTILFLAIFFALRRKNLFAECGLRAVKPSALLWCALAGTAFNIVISVTISLLPLPEAWFTGLDEQYQYLGESNILLEILSTAVITGLVEEVIFRGLSESRMRRGMPAWLAVILSALVFGVCHGTPIAIGYATLLGAVFSVMNRRYDSILPSVIMHMFFNAAALWFVTDDTLLVLAMYLICLGVLLGSLYLYFRHPDEENAPDRIPENEPDPETINTNQL